MANEALSHLEACKVIERALGVAVGNLTSHVRVLEQKYHEAKTWSDQVMKDQDNVIRSLETTISQLRMLPANMEFSRFFPELDTPRKGSEKLVCGANTTLQAFGRQEDVQNAVNVVNSGRRSMSSHIEKLGTSVSMVIQDADELVSDVKAEDAESIVYNGEDASKLMQEIEIISKKIASDYEHVLSLPASSKSVPQVSKMALLHTRNYLPSMRESCLAIGDNVRLATERGNSAASLAVSKMQKIAIIESAFAQVNAQVMALDVPQDVVKALDLITLLSQLPFAYGALLIEAVRRIEWSDRIKGESAIIVEEIASYREEEERRRKKWFNNIGHLVNEDVITSDVLNFEVNLQSEDAQWPQVSRHALSEYLQALRTLPGLDVVVEELAEAVKDLDRPTKQQVKKAKSFKMGSFHETTSGKGSFLLREKDEITILRSNNLKLEEDMKSQKSRIRKLEDMLHKQSQNIRTASSNDIFQTHHSPASDFPLIDPLYSTARTQESLSRKSSGTARRLSTNNASNETTVARRIATLEADLAQESQKCLGLQKDIDASREREGRMQTVVDESRCTNKDLMENMEAQQREFGNERRVLEEEVEKSKIKVEEVEDELDRILGSRDNERSGADDRLRALEAELDKKNKFLSSLEDAKRRDAEIQQDQMRKLRSAYSRLSPEQSAPESTAELIHMLDDLAERAARHANDLTRAVEATKSNNEKLQATITKQDANTSTINAQILALEKDMSTLRNDSAIEQARTQSLTAELDDRHTQLRSLQAKFAEGVTESEALRQRVEELGARASTLARELAEAKSSTNSLDVELCSLRRKHSNVQKETENAATRLDRCSNRALNLTEKLVSRNEEMARLLDALGLSITDRDGAMVIQRASKIPDASTILLDPNASNGQIPSILYSASRSFEIRPDQPILQWAQAETTEEEGIRFAQLTAKTDHFNLGTFSEAIIKLRRDVEWTGKKWKMEARGYRDKYHRALSEAYDKIAFRSFKEGDLALFLPTRNQANRPWAAFNVGAPHYFLREQDSHKLRNREWIVARISKMSERVVDLSKNMDSLKGEDGRSIGEASDGGVSFEDDNPFELSDGLRWYLLEAAEEKAGAPSTPGLGKTTVASAHVDVKGIRMKQSASGNDASKKLNKSLESRRSSSNSKRASIPTPASKEVVLETVMADHGEIGELQRRSSVTSPGSRSSAAVAGLGGLGVEIVNSNEEVRRDQLWGP